MTARNDPANDRADDAFDRVRAADPASGAEPDAAALDRALRDRLGDAVPGGSGAEGARSDLAAGPVAAESAGVVGPTAGLARGPVAGPAVAAESRTDVTSPSAVDELTVRRTRRLAPLRVAATVAGVLVVGAGGYALGAAGASGPTDAVATQRADAPILLEDLSAVAESDASAEPARAGSTYPGFWGGRIVFHDGGLPTGGGNASAWAYDAAGVFSADTARRVAAALGVEGDVREEYGALVVGSSDYTGPFLSLQPDGLASVNFTDPSKDPWSCGIATPEPAPAEIAPAEPAPAEPAPADGAGSSSSGGTTEPGAPDEPCQPKEQGPAPSAEAATASFRDLLGSLGVDPAGFEFEAQTETKDTAATWMNAYEVVDGQRTGNSWNATFVGSGVYTLNGWLAQRVPIGAYEVISPAEAVERLGDPRFGAGYGPIAMAVGAVPGARLDTGAEAADAPADSSVSSPTDTPTVPATVGADSPIAWPVTDVTITGARLGTAVSYQPDGAAVLLPAYELTDSDGNSWSVVAVADSRLDFAAARP